MYPSRPMRQGMGCVGPEGLRLGHPQAAPLPCYRDSMHRAVLPVAFFSVLVLTTAFAPPQDGHPSKASEIVSKHQPTVKDDPESRTKAAYAFLASLEEEQLNRVLFPLDSDEHKSWTNVPPGRQEAGLKLGELSEVQVRLALDLLASGLSDQGYRRAKEIMLADDKLLRGGRARTGFGTAEFWLVVLGEPSATERWALQFDGHHLAYNIAFHGEEVTMSPSFIGTQPSTYGRAEARVIPMKEHVDPAYGLLAALSEEARGEAILGARRGSIETGPGRDGHVPERRGASLAGLSKEGRGELEKLLRAFVDDLPAPAAEKRMKVLLSEVEQMHFAWWGPTTNPSDISFRLQGPTVVIEFACQDLGGDPLDHLHAMYRNPGNEYGAGF